MENRREVGRRKARERRAGAKREADERVDRNCRLAAKALDQLRIIVSAPEFKQFLPSRSVQTLPSFLTVQPGQLAEYGGDHRSRLEMTSLQFAVSWRFLYPLLEDADVFEYLNRLHPNFIPEVRTPLSR
jgi:hypothetical protein